MWICNCILFLSVLHLTHSQRRISHGLNVTMPKPYMVYLLKRSHTPRNYDAWLCGGALVKPDLVLTSAACLVDIEFAMVIAGTLKYNANPDENECANKIKKRIIITYRYRNYELDYEKVSKWSNVDIGLARMETSLSPEQFMQKMCDYTPEPILINYDPTFESPGSNALVLGWGHLSHWRKPKDKTDLNSRYLKYITTNVVAKHICRDAYNAYGMANIINNYMICTRGPAGLDEAGLEADYVEASAVRSVDPGPDGCDPSQEEIEGATGLQNDHGGPIVAWKDDRPWLIGVSSVFMIDNENKCVGPFLYTSTACTNAFIRCIVDPESIKRISRRSPSPCDLPPHEKGYDTIIKKHSWKGHPDGPALNEIDDTEAENTTLATSYDKTEILNMNSKSTINGTEIHNTTLKSSINEIEIHNSTFNTSINEIEIDNSTLNTSIYEAKILNTNFKNSINGTDNLSMTLKSSINETGILNTDLKTSFNETEIDNTTLKSSINETGILNTDLKTSFNETEIDNTTLKSSINETDFSK